MRNTTCFSLVSLVLLSILALFSSGGECADLERLWTSEGLELDTVGADILLSDKNGGAITIWKTWNYPIQIRAQRYDANGNALWDSHGKLVSDATTAERPAAAESVFGGIIVAWVSDGKVYAQRLDANGNKVWNNGTGALVFSGVSGRLDVCSDGIGGAYIKNGSKLNHVLEDGQVPGGDFGIYLGYGLSIISDGQGRLFPLPSVRGGVFAVWYEDVGYQIRAQHFKAGTQWGSQGVLVHTAESSIISDLWTASLVNDGEGGLIVVWHAWYGFIQTGEGEIRAQRLNSSGVRLWGDDGTMVLNTDDVGGAKEAWYTLLQRPDAISDGNRGVILSWLDMRLSADTIHTDVYSQRLDGNGVPQWAANGIWIRKPWENLSEPPPTKGLPIMASDGLGGALIVYESYITWLHRLDADGITIGYQSSVDILIDTARQNKPKLTFDATGPSPKGAVVAWTADWGSFAQKIEISQTPADNDSIQYPAQLNQPYDLNQRGLYGSIYWATNDGSASCGQPGQPDLWYRLTAPATGTLRVDTCGTNDMFGIDSGVDTVLSLLGAGLQGNLIELDCNDNSPIRACGGKDRGAIRDSVVTRELTTGQTVLIRLSRYDDATTGLYRLNWRFNPATTPGNFDLDEDVDGQDLEILASDYGCTVDCTADLDGDGDVDSDDVEIFADFFGQINPI